MKHLLHCALMATMAGLIVCTGCSEVPQHAVQPDEPSAGAARDGDSTTEGTDNATTGGNASTNSGSTTDEDYPPFQPGLTPAVDPNTGRSHGPVIESTLPNIDPITLPEPAEPAKATPMPAR